MRIRIVLAFVCLLGAPVALATESFEDCLLYTSDAADDLLQV